MIVCTRYVKPMTVPDENRPKFTVDEFSPPPLDSVYYWERGLDPAHVDAFKDTELDRYLPESNEPRKEGWMAIDYHENPTGFVPDGTEVPFHKEDYILAMGPYGHFCAYTSKAYEETRTRKYKN